MYLERFSAFYDRHTHKLCGFDIMQPFHITKYLDSMLLETLWISFQAFEDGQRAYYAF